MPVSLGFDPEYFVKHIGGDIVPICGLLGGTKEAPLEFGCGYNYHEDNVVAEIGVPPAHDYYTANDILSVGISLLDTKLESIGLARCGGLPEHKFTAAQLSSRSAQEFGCDPDFDAYTGGADPRLNIPSFGNYRFAGGHIHLGGDFNCPPFVVALMCDLMLMIPYGTGKNCGKERKKWYGIPGIFRTKDYGIEYRSLSCNWTDDVHTRLAVCRSAFILAEWLENTPARGIKKVLDAMDWLSLRESLLQPSATNRDSRNIAFDVALSLGVPS